MDPENIAAIVNWPSEVRSFHGLESFHRKFIRNFSEICAPMLDTIKKASQPFRWTDATERSFHLLKKNITERPIIRFLDFKKLFQNDTDFKEAYEACQNPLVRNNSPWLDYNLQEKLLFRGGQLCIPDCSMRENIIQEKHNGGDEVLAHLRKEHFPRGAYNKLKYKKIGPCKVLQKFSANAYELQLPPGIGISPICNVVDLFPYTTSPEEGSTARPTWDIQEGSDTCMRQMPYAQPLEIERILDTQVAKRTRQKEYLQYLVKWKNRPIEDSSWLNTRQIE
eukprot:PITA_02905